MSILSGKRGEKIGLIFASIGVLLVVCRLRFGVSLPLYIPHFLFVIYPSIVLFQTNHRNRLADVCYLTLFGIGYGGMFTFPAHYPIGYSDVHYHLMASERLLSSNGLDIHTSASLSFILLYLFVNTASVALDVPISEVARLLPMLTYTGTIVAFFAFASRSFFDDIRKQLMVTVLFASNWGVFRYSLEFRTLNVALLAGILTLGLMLAMTLQDRGETRLIGLTMFFMIITGLSHLTTFVFTLFLAVILWVAYFRTTHTRYLAAIMLITGIIIYGYITHFAGNFQSTVYTILFASPIDLGGATSRDVGAKSEGAVGLTYGFRLFVVEWIYRGIFLASAIAFFFGVVLKQRRRIDLFLFLSGAGLSAILVFSALLGSSINPGRVFTFFSIPFSIVYVAGLLHYADTDRDKIRKAILIIAVFVLAIAVLLSGLKLPQYLIGDTDPIRGDAEVDTFGWYIVEQSDLNQRTFLEQYGPTYLNYDQHRLGSWFYPPDGDESSNHAIIDRPDWRAGSDDTPAPSRSIEAHETINECSIIYTSDTTRIAEKSPCIG
jgi:hypothetical protein